MDNNDQDQMPPRAFTDPDWVKERTLCLSEFLDGGLFTTTQLLGIRDMCNLTLAGSSTSHPMWIKNKTMPTPPAEDADLVYRTIMAARIAEKLAHLPFLDYANATDEDSLTMLMLSAIQAGFRPLPSVDQAYSYFETSAPGPMLKGSDAPERGKEKGPVNGPLEPLDPGWLREAPYLEAIRRQSTGMVDNFAQQFKNMTQSEQDDLIVAMGIPVPEKPVSRNQAVFLGDEDTLPGSQVMPSHVGLGAEIASGLGPMLVQLQASIDGMAALARKRAKGSDSDEEEDLSGEARLEKLLRFGGAQLHKKKMTLADFQRETDTDKIRDAQRIRKVEGSTKYELLWNQALDEQTVMLVQLEEIGHERLSDTLSKSAKASCAVYEQTVHTQLRGLKERMEMIAECMRLEKAKHKEEAEKLFSLYLEKLCNKSENKLLSKLRLEAKAQVKQDKELILLEAVAKISSGGGAQQGWQQQGGPQSGQQAIPIWTSTGGQPTQTPRGKGKGGKGGSGSFAMEWIDGAYFNASLAGVQAPSPKKFPGFHLARLDSVSGGIVHTPGWKGTCGACGAVGHGHSECEARRWTMGAQEFVNVRWLYTNGFCDAQGEKK